MLDMSAGVCRSAAETRLPSRPARFRTWEGLRIESIRMRWEASPGADLGAEATDWLTQELSASWVAERSHVSGLCGPQRPPEVPLALHTHGQRTSPEGRRGT